jgi:hypothetical protein
LRSLVVVKSSATPPHLSNMSHAQGPTFLKGRRAGALHMKHSSYPSITNPIDEYIVWLRYPSNMASNCAFQGTFHKHVNLINAGTFVACICLRSEICLILVEFIHSLCFCIATMARLLLSFAQLSVVFALPAGGTKPESINLKERAVSISTDLQPTISYSSAITSLQSVTISILPSITGVCTSFSRAMQSHKTDIWLTSISEHRHRVTFWWCVHPRSHPRSGCYTVGETSMST